MNPEYIALSLVILLFSVIVHEVCHGLMARYFGDRTAENAGRLTLNPIPHIDPIGTIVLPLILFISNAPFLFGWAKPVPINPLNFSDIKRGELWTALAGVMANFGLALIAALLFHLAGNFTSEPLVLELLVYTVTINLALGIFNLLPIPPLDGSKVLMALLPYDLARQFMALEPYGMFIMIALLMIPVGGSSIISLILGVSVGLIKLLLQIP